MLVWKAPNDVQEIVSSIKSKFHHPRLEEAKIAISFNDAKPFINERLNLGKTSKFSTLAKLWHPDGKQYDFHISLPSDVWHSVLTGVQREAWMDLHLCRCQVDYIPETVEVNGKKRPVRDDWGRVKYTTEIKRDEDGSPKWVLDPLDLMIFQENVTRFGCWFPMLMDMKSACDKVKSL
jgi:hypothetical protein